jgi:hypothetical protein
MAAQSCCAMSCSSSFRSSGVTSGSTPNQSLKTFNRLMQQHAQTIEGPQAMFACPDQHGRFKRNIDNVGNDAVRWRKRKRALELALAACTQRCRIDDQVCARHEFGQSILGCCGHDCRVHGRKGFSLLQGTIHHMNLPYIFLDKAAAMLRAAPPAPSMMMVDPATSKSGHVCLRWARYPEPSVDVP